MTQDFVHVIYSMVDLFLPNNSEHSLSNMRAPIELATAVFRVNADDMLMFTKAYADYFDRLKRLELHLLQVQYSIGVYSFSTFSLYSSVHLSLQYSHCDSMMQSTRVHVFMV